MVSRAVKRILAGILILILYFSIFIPLSPQFISLVESFVSRYSDIFTLRFPITEFVHNTTSNSIEKTVRYVEIDLSIVLVFITYFLVYLVVPFSVVFTVFRK
ncbi:MAG: hypothetical protein QXX12_03990 [Nanopusillaceae archaeon]